MPEGVYDQSVKCNMQWDWYRKDIWMKILFATGNAGKMKEIRMILADLGMEIRSLKDAGIDVDIEENGATFAENAKIKVLALREYVDSETIILADDSGLVVDALDGAPGVYSARYMGYNTSYDEKNANIIQRVNESGRERSARFTAAIAALLPDGRIAVTEGHMEGEIATEPAGAGGFGYDPILYLPAFGVTSAELSPEEKNAISHRGQALEKMKDYLREALQLQ